MATVQSVYREERNAAIAGMIANATTRDIYSFIYNSDTPLPFGFGVQRDITPGNHDKCLPGLTDVNRYLGIAVQDKNLRPNQEDRYFRGDVVSVLRRGDIWVPLDFDVVITDNVYIDKASGRLSAVPNDGVEAINVTAGGANYDAGTTVTITRGGGDTTGAGATATATVVGGVITAIEVTNPGTGYTRVPTIAFANAGSGTGAAATAVLQDAFQLQRHEWMTPGEKDGLARVQMSAL